MTLTAEEAPVVASTSAQRRERWAKMAREREERFLERSQRLNADPNVDPRRRDWYLDRTLVNNIEAAERLGLTSPQRIYGSGKRGDEMEVRVPPHPSAYLEIDEVNQTGKCVELGRLLELAEQARGYTLDVETGTLIKGRIRHGRTRHERTNMSKRQPPGAGRRGGQPKQRTGD